MLLETYYCAKQGVSDGGMRVVANELSAEELEAVVFLAIDTEVYGVAVFAA